MCDFDKDRWEVCWDRDRNCTILFEAHCEEKVQLKAGKRWHLRFDDEEGAYVGAEGEESLWCEDVLNHFVYDEDGVIHVVTPQDEDLTLTAFRRRFSNIKVPFKAVSDVDPKVAHAYLLKQCVSGCVTLWSLKDVYEKLAAQGEKFKFSKWYQNWWKWWRKTAASLSWEDGFHFRKAAAVNGAGTGEAPAADEGDEERFLPEPVVSSYALVLVLAQGAAESRGKPKDPDERLAWELALKTTIDRFFDAETEARWTIYLDPNAMVRPGLPVQGRNDLRLAVRGCKVDLSPIALSDEPSIQVVRDLLLDCADTASMRLSDLLMLLVKNGKQCTWLLRQVLWHLGAWIDYKVQLEERKLDPSQALDVVSDDYDKFHGPDTLVTSSAQDKGARRRSKFADKMKIAYNTTKHVGMRLLQMFFCMRSVFSDCSVFGFAFDASRIGGRSRLLGFITLPTGVGAWLPPQAPPMIVDRCGSCCLAIMPPTSTH